MEKNRTRAKLMLSRETVQILNLHSLEGAEGGTSYPPSYACTVTCYTCYGCSAQCAPSAARPNGDSQCFCV